MCILQPKMGGCRELFSYPEIPESSPAPPLPLFSPLSRAQLARLKDRLHDRLTKRSIADPETDCWVYTGCRHHKTSTGMIRVGGRMLPVARVAMWVYEGGFELHDRSVRVIHTGCKNRACFNPEHLRVVERGAVNTELARLGRFRLGGAREFLNVVAAEACTQ